MPNAILEQMGDSTAQAGVSGIVAKLRKAIRIKIPIGYQDETGFHLGLKPAEKTSQVVAGLEYSWTTGSSRNKNPNIEFENLWE